MPEEPVGRYSGEGISVEVFADGSVELYVLAMASKVSLTAEQWITLRGFVEFVVERVR